MLLAMHFDAQFLVQHCAEEPEAIVCSSLKLVDIAASDKNCVTKSNRKDFFTQANGATAAENKNGVFVIVAFVVAGGAGAKLKVAQFHV